MSPNLLLVSLLALLGGALAGCLNAAPTAGDDGDNTTMVENGAAEGIPGDVSNATSGAPATAKLNVKGKTSGTACVFSAVVGRCQSAASGENTFQEIEAEGVPIHMVGTLTWTAASPLSQRMSVFLMRETSDGWMADSDSPYVSGPSPLAFDWDLSAYEPDAKFALSIGDWQSSGGGFCPACAWVSTSTPQEFTLVGEFHSLKH